jgi:preprotein translocase subunit SecA
MILQHANELLTRTFRSPRHPPGRWRRLAGQIDRLATQLEAKPDAELRTLAAATQFRVRSGEPLDVILRDAFALVVESSRRHIGLRHYRVQILGGIALHSGGVAEMQTGEGKTLAATLPLFLNALRGQPVHLATANDYLAQRDADLMRPMFESLGLSVGAVTGDMSPVERRTAYDCDITYGTAREFGFDFLRDRLTLKARGFEETSLFAESLHVRSLAELQAGPARSLRERLTVQRHPLHFALIDEADSLLIDEARTPLIISSEQGDRLTQEALFRWCAGAVGQFELNEHLEADADTGRFELTRPGFRLMRALPKPPQLDELPMSDIIDALLQAAYAASNLRCDEHYVVRDGKVQIVDEFTGRIAEGRKWRNGVHQAVEAREGVDVSPLTAHCARITVQELFGLYDRISGMTGTATSAACELLSVYQLPVYRIPTHRKVRRDEQPPLVLESSDARWQAVTDEAREITSSGRPVLIGTRTIAQSEQLSSLLTEAGLEHEILNARNHALEAEIVSEAGHPGRITVATNMAGRGTDIVLQGNAEELGGLHVICSEPHAAARIDRQLVGRCSRQGDPGSFRQFMSLEDAVLREGLSEADMDSMWKSASIRSNAPALVSGFRRAQKRLERQHEQERQMLLVQARMRARQLVQLGQDPWLDAV